MKLKDMFLSDLLDFDSHEAENLILWRATTPVSVYESQNCVVAKVPFYAQSVKGNVLTICEEIEPRYYDIHLKAYTPNILRIVASFNGNQNTDDNIMFEWNPCVSSVKLKVVKTRTGYEIFDHYGQIRACFTRPEYTEIDNENFGRTKPDIQFCTFPDGVTAVPFSCYDNFTPHFPNSMPLGFVTDNENKVVKSFYSFSAKMDECFVGTGERFAKMDLSGQIINLENTDALGTNSRRAYKNVPFFISSRKYGILNLTSAHVRLSLAAVSTQAVSGVINDGLVDIFVIGGSSIESITRSYRKLTGFPRMVPLWSMGMWMSRMSYFSAQQAREAADKLRENNLPCDVIHLDTGWFEKDWDCDWKFSKTRFPEPEKFIKEMNEKGFKISLWQLPTLTTDNALFDEAVEKGYVAYHANGCDTDATSNFGEQENNAVIDFTNPKAVVWYKSLLENLFKKGVSAIKADFGEQISMKADYHKMSAAMLHNLYALYYQKAVYEATEQSTGEAVMFARAGWIGCQRYPVHWAGDTISNWSGLAGVVRGALHLGLSGFGFWSNDIGGFYGVPDFMKSKPSDDLYLRWLQFGVFCSHIRFHGTNPREPYEYPNVLCNVRKWMKLRYILMPYFYKQAQQVTTTGFPFLRAMIFHHPDDTVCWKIDNQFYSGDSFLIAPVTNSSGIRDVYIPEGDWVDFWEGEKIQGPVMLKNVQSNIKRIPIYVKNGAAIDIYPEPVSNTSQMDMSKVRIIKFDNSYRGIKGTTFEDITGL